MLPSVLLGIAQFVLPTHPADVRAFGVDGAASAGGVVVPASAVAPVEKTGFLGQVDVLAAQAALGAGEGAHVI